MHNGDNDLNASTVCRRISINLRAVVSVAARRCACVLFCFFLGGGGGGGEKKKFFKKKGEGGVGGKGE